MSRLWTKSEFLPQIPQMSRTTPVGDQRKFFVIPPLCAIRGKPLLDFRCNAPCPWPPEACRFRPLRLRYGPFGIVKTGRGDVIVNERAVDVHISHLRKKLGDDPPKLIKTVRGVGYVLSKDPT